MFWLNSLRECIVYSVCNLHTMRKLVSLTIREAYPCFNPGKPGVNTSVLGVRISSKFGLNWVPISWHSAVAEIWDLQKIWNWYFCYEFWTQNCAKKPMFIVQWTLQYNTVKIVTCAVTCVTGHCTCDDFILWYIGGVIVDIAITK